jgi:CRP/FNR family cyclic AMP-dependent transcriptional regulator
MASSIPASQSRPPLEDVLMHLPVAGVVPYRKGQIIYGPEVPSNRLYLVAAGTVDLSHVAADGSEVLLDIVRPEELFGEMAFHAAPRDSERAIAHENTSVMAWSTSEIEDLVANRPRLAVALLQILAQRNADLARRVESLAMDTIERRLARSLIRFADRLGTRQDDGSVRMLPLTHGLLSRYVGTSREIISHYMNRFRKQGYLDYSRSGIQLHRDALQATLSDQAAVASSATN